MAHDEKTVFGPPGAQQCLKLAGRGVRHPREDIDIPLFFIGYAFQGRTKEKGEGRVNARPCFSSPPGEGVFPDRPSHDPLRARGCLDMKKNVLCAFGCPPRQAWGMGWVTPLPYADGSTEPAPRLTRMRRPGSPNREPARWPCLPHVRPGGMVPDSPAARSFPARAASSSRGHQPRPSMAPRSSRSIS